MKNRKKAVRNLFLASGMAVSLSSCQDIVNYFDNLGQSFPTYDKCFGDNPNSKCFGRDNASFDSSGQPSMVRHALPANSAQPQSPDVDKYLQQPGN